MHHVNSPEGMLLLGQGEAIVVDVQNNGKAHTVRILHPDLGTTDFIPYIQTAGLYRIPRVGDKCFTFCKEAFHQYPVAWGNIMTKAQIKVLVGDREDNITILYSGGPDNNEVSHRIELDDGADRGVRITTAGGNKLDLKNEDEIQATHHTGSFIKMNADVIELSVKGTTLRLSSEGLELISAQGASIKVTDGVTSESSAGSKEVLDVGYKVTSSEGSEVDVSNTIKGKAADTFSKFDNVVVSTHQHPGNLGYPTSAPIKTGA